MRTVRARLLIGALLLAMTAGCGASSERTASDSGAAAPPQAQQEGAPPAQDAKSGNALAVPVGAPVDTRSIVYKGELTVRAKNVSEAAAKASTIATGAGGVIAGDNRQSNDVDETADLVLRVPSAAFHSTVNKLSKDLGEELNRGLNSEDVTEAVVDLDARIAGQKASVDRTRALLARAQQIGEIVTIEQELARREGELASLQARKRALSDQVTLSTITLHLIGPRAEAPKVEDDTPTFLSGLAAGWDAFTSTVNWALVIFGAMLPFLAAIAIPVVVLVWIVRRRRPRPEPIPVAAPES